MPHVEIQYPIEIPKPQIPNGLGFPERALAHQALLAYHTDPAFLPDDDDFYYRGLASFLRNHPPHPSISADDLRRFVDEHPVTDSGYDTATLYLTRTLERIVRESKTLRSTCPYRTVEASVVGRMDLGHGNYLNIGGVGSNGGHEYTVIPPPLQIGIVTQMMVECLATVGVPLRPEDTHRWQLAESIAGQLVEERLNDPFIHAPSCMDISSIAISGARLFAQHTGHELPISLDSFKGCLMHRMNREAYEKVGLTAPPKLGRKHCISACAEQNALMNEKEAANIARFIPLGKNDAVYVISQEGSFIVETQSNEHIPTTQYTYYIVRSGTHVMELKTITIDERLLWHPVSGKNRDNLLWVSQAFSNDVRSRFHQSPDSFFILHNSSILGFLGDGDTYRITSPPCRTQAIITPLCSIPLSHIGNIRRFHITPSSLHSTQVPCLYCTRAIIEQKVQTTYIDTPTMDDYKGDDGLSLEYLQSVYRGTVLFC